VLVEAHAEGDDVVVRISDDGPGLPPQLVDGPKAFVTTKRGGLGLGLPIAVKVLALHEGRLTLRPNRPRGVVAEVVLPCGACSGSLPLVAAVAVPAGGEEVVVHSQDVVGE
jgi:C4-dicarboxylate-specific signal transduction histidine kinase